MDYRYRLMQVPYQVILEDSDVDVFFCFFLNSFCI